ncbi:MAG: hypothetical protein COV66_08050 [Nitrospinae bacterium CG11_big_fil_rev_8_21_14_0_20_45_15]|nr:MAG: hypothetical protein COV66_08050 [Nitrospinae bacterium CG11_big_fil_rev_8_21_14_0_20_45_15]
MADTFTDNFNLTKPEAGKVSWDTDYAALADLIDSRFMMAGKNAIINGACQVAQRPAPNISGSYQYGKVDRIAAKADGTPTAGTISQSETTLLGSSGYASHLSGVSTGAGGAMYWRYRIESRDVQRFISQAGIFSAKVYHNVGSAQNFTITINKANAKDDFSAVTLISASGNLSVEDATETAIEFAVADLASCGNGIEIIVKCDCGAVTTKDFYLADLQFEKGNVATELEPRPIALEFAMCQRYYQQYGEGSNEMLGTSAVHSATTAFVIIPFQTTMRTTPTVTYDSTLSNYLVRISGSSQTPTSLNNDVITPRTMSINIGITGGTVGDCCFMYSPPADGISGLIKLSAEL